MGLHARSSCPGLPGDKVRKALGRTQPPTNTLYARKRVREFHEESLKISHPFILLSTSLFALRS